jgi:hypothetical protein
VSNLIEALGFALIVFFLYLCWPPLAVLGAGLLLVAWANTRRSDGRLAAAAAAALGAARRAYRSAKEPPPAELRSVA